MCYRGAMENTLPKSPVADARFWDRMARRYAASPIKDQAGYERTLARTRHYLRETDDVLELGCGTGSTALLLSPHVRRYTATDVSPGMIAIARQKAAVSARQNLSFASAGAGDLTGEAALDAVLAFNLLHLLAGLEDKLGRIHSALRPGGLFISKTPCLSEMNPLIRVAVPVMRWTGFAPHVAFFTAAELETAIVAAGFTIVERARHGSGRKDARIFIAARKPAGEVSSGHAEP